MCDYSLEMYDSRAAREGEVYVTTRFPSGSVGLTSPASAETAICLACGSRLTLENLSPEAQQAFGVKETETVAFVRLDQGLYRDGVEFENGLRLPFNRLGIGVMVSLADATPERAAKAEAPVAKTESDTALEPAE